MSETIEKTADGRILRRGAYPELTWHAVVVGWVLGILIAISIGYASLIMGFSIEGSELAAILGFAILRGLFNRRSIVENNINQTVASAVNGASSGMMFSVAGLFVLHNTNKLLMPELKFNVTFMVLSCIVGAILGVAFIIPLRKQMIDYNRLPYPGGIAVATILKAPGAGMKKAQLMLGAALLSGVVHYLVTYPLHAVFPHGEFNLGAIIGMPEYMNGVWAVSLMMIGVGFLSGKGGLFFVIGGYVCYWILAPVLDSMGIIPAAAKLAEMGTSAPGFLRGELFRPLGIGMLVGGAVIGVLLAGPLIVGAIRSMQSAAKTKAAHSKDEMPIKLLYVAIVAAFFVLFAISALTTSEFGWGRGAIMALLGTLWIWVAGVILSECIGRTNWSPLSGMTLIGITILLLVASGAGTTEGIIAAFLVGAAMCVAMSQATDMMMDLKTGYLVGATPKKQQYGQMIGVWLGPIVIMTLIFVLNDKFQIGSKALPAPQATALAGVVGAILDQNVPIQTYAAGAGLGALLSATGIGGLGILVGLGFYMPFGIVLTYTIGTILRLVSNKVKGPAWCDNTGVPIAAGLLIGEALVGVGGAITSIVGGA